MRRLFERFILAATILTLLTLGSTGAARVFDLLDEPEAALSPQRQLTLLMEIDRCVKAGSQFIIVTHSPILLGLPGAQILSFDDGPIHSCSYKDTDSYRITSLFINNREGLLKNLLED